MVPQQGGSDGSSWTQLRDWDVIGPVWAQTPGWWPGDAAEESSEHSGGELATEASPPHERPSCCGAARAPSRVFAHPADPTRPHWGGFAEKPEGSDAGWVCGCL